MTSAESSDPVATADVLEQQYRRIIARWYPAAWTAVNGEALIGTLLDDAEHRGAGRIAVRTHLDLARHGAALRAVDALPLEVRTATASVSAGVVTAYSVLLVLVGSRTPADRLAAHGGASPLLDSTHLLALTPFLVAWLLVASLAFGSRRRWFLIVLVAAITVTVVCSPLWFLPAPMVPFAYGWDTWWGSIAYAFPASAANLVFLVCAASAGFVGRARFRPFACAVLVTGLVGAGALVLRTGTVGLFWPDWFWSPTRHAAPSVVSVPLVLAAVAVTSSMLMRTGSRRWAVALSLSAVPVLLGWLTELVVDPVIFIAL